MLYGFVVLNHFSVHDKSIIKMSTTPISLVVCLRGERDLLERLLSHVEGCYDDLVVIHDGMEGRESRWTPVVPSLDLAIDWGLVSNDAPLPVVFIQNQTSAVSGSLREYIEGLGGRFFEHPRIGSLEGQSPFAWWAARHNWILRLDADEFPSEQLKQWLINFRSKPVAITDISGYTCIWPFWNGYMAVGDKWPDKRIFLFNKANVKMVGIPEMTPVGDGQWIPVPLVLHHIPKRKSYGFRNILWRRQAWVWRMLIAQSLLKSPLALPRWNWSESVWPPPFSLMANTPIRYALKTFFLGWRWSTKNILKYRMWRVLYYAPAFGWHHVLICFNVFGLRISQKYKAWIKASSTV